MTFDTEDYVTPGVRAHRRHPQMAGRDDDRGGRHRDVLRHRREGPLASRSGGAAMSSRPWPGTTSAATPISARST
ncbi:MAG: hypothetical protein MZU84_09510 [Sphingobacterium sp.]|nr:hypothetical protein [Sphingobacterium sp.]